MKSNYIFKRHETHYSRNRIVIQQRLGKRKSLHSFLINKVAYKEETREIPINRFLLLFLLKSEFIALPLPVIHHPQISITLWQSESNTLNLCNSV